MKDTSVLVDTGNDSQIEIFLSQIDEYTSEYLQRFPNDEESCSAENFTTLLRYVYSHVFKPTANNKSIYDRNTYQNTQNSILDYSNIEDLDRIFDAYLELCARFKQCPTILGFCSLSGIDKDTITTWKNGQARSKSPAHMRTTKEWFSVCESALAQRAIMSNSIGSIFALKCAYNWRETCPVGPEEMPALQHESAAEIMQRHSAARLPERPDLSEFD